MMASKSAAPSSELRFAPLKPVMMKSGYTYSSSLPSNSWRIRSSTRVVVKSTFCTSCRASSFTALLLPGAMLSRTEPRRWT